MSEIHECPAEGCDYESESLTTVSVHVTQSSDHDDDLQYPTDEMVIDELQRVADKLGEAPTQIEMNDFGSYSHKLYVRRFGSWNEALDKAGLEPNMERNISDEDLINEIQRLADELDRPPKLEDMDVLGTYGILTYQRRFGSWNEALDEAGLEPNMEMNISDEDLINEIQRLADELGKTPTESDMDVLGTYGITTYYRRFGSWNEALDEAGLEKNLVKSGSSDDFLTSTERYAWRKAVYQRDSYTCQDCGRTDVQLNAHHINHRADNPDLETMVWNGVTLCQACHAERHADDHVYSLIYSDVSESDVEARNEHLRERGNPHFLDYWDDVPFAREPSNEPILPNFTNL